jgi:hypothetical protein
LPATAARKADALLAELQLLPKPRLLKIGVLPPFLGEPP